MQGKRILIVGCGKIGLRVAKELALENQVWGLRKGTPETIQGLELLSADVTNVASLARAFQNIPPGIHYIIYCLTPGERSEQGYRAIYVTGLKNTLEALPDTSSLKRILFISSTSVFHQNDSQWLDESSDTLPTSFSGRVLLEAEALLKTFDISSTVIRFSGIYGQSRSRLIQQVKQQEALISHEIRLTNRIHEDDCVGFILHLIRQDMQSLYIKPLYIATDDEPINLNEVISFIAKRLNVEVATPEKQKDEQRDELKGEQADNSRRSGNKRLSNKRMLDSGYPLKFPSYKEGYLEMLKAR